MCPHLQETEVGRTVNGLKRRDGLDADVADLARTIVRKWKDIVAKHDEQEEEAEEEQQVVSPTNQILSVLSFWT